MLAVLTLVLGMPQQGVRDASLPAAQPVLECPLIHQTATTSADAAPSPVTIPQAQTRESRIDLAGVQGLKVRIIALASYDTKP
jgi:hypothetical protein